METFQSKLIEFYQTLSKLSWEVKKLREDFLCQQCNQINTCLGISSKGSDTKFLNEKGDFITISFSGFSCTDLLNCSTSNLPEGSNLYFTNNRAISALTGENISIFNNDIGYITSSALTGYATETYVNSQGFITSSALAPYLTSANAALTYYPLTNPSGYTSNTGTVTSVAALTLGTTGTDINSTVANSTTTPVITLNVPTASATNRGALSSTDWSTFNNKQAALGFTPENINNKQNSLAVDGTGTKYPTVDAVNAALSNASNPLIKVYSTQNFI
mgnify:FL=1